MPADGQNDLVRDLTTKLEQLQREKAELERAVEGQADSIALKLRLTLLAYEQQKPPSSSQPHTHRHRSKSRSSASSSLSTSASTSSSTSFPSSPPTQTSSILPVPDLSPDVVTALRENETLRVRLANSERVNAYYQRELAELRRRCGISIDELEELDLSGGNSLQAPRAGGSGMLRRPRSSSRSSSRMDPAGATASIRIPGAASVSPPATGGARLSTASFPFSASTNSLRFAAPQSYMSYASSINTTATTPSSSYPNARPPAPTPATAAAFSPVSFVNTIGSAGSGAGGAALGRRNSLNSFVATHFASAAGPTASMQAVAEAESREIDLDDLVHLTPQPASSPPPSNTTGTVPFPSLTNGSLAAPPSGSTRSSRSSTTSASSSHIFPPGSTASSSLENSISSLPPRSAVDAPAMDPLIAAITRSLAKLAAQSEGGSRGRRRRASATSAAGREEGEVGDTEGRARRKGKRKEGAGEAEEGSSGSSETSRDDDAEGAMRKSGVLGRCAPGEEEDGDGVETPLSCEVAGEGGLSRRASAREASAR
ncbi:hypothetical protein JCM10296v2_002554 [Rhodotorula toruloides]